MIHFILGGSGSGKSTCLREKIKETAEKGKQIYLFVPEQFTLETERNYYRLLSPEIFQKVTITSFTRLAYQVFKTFGGVSGDYADDSIKLILMNLALNEVKDGLCVYGKTVKNVQFSKMMVDFVTELKNADLTCRDFEFHLKNLEEGLLRKKSEDISLIYSSYEAFLSSSYKDSLDDLTRASEKIQLHNFFKDTVIFMDEFKGFTQKEFELIRLMMQQASEMYFTLCMSDPQLHLFQSVNQTAQKLRRIAREQGCSISAPILLTENHRFRSPELVHLEQNVFRNRIEKFQGENHAVCPVLAANEYDETEYVLATIRTLVEEEGYRYRDIVVISRDLAAYENCLETAFEKYHVPFYWDSRKSIASHPLIRMIELAFDCISGGFSSENLISMLKCGLTPFDYQDISELENYIYLWDLKPEDWKQDFSFSIYGMNQPKGEEQLKVQEEALFRINRIRHMLYEALDSFGKKAEKGSAQQISQAMIDFLEELGVRERINCLISQQSGENLSAEMTLADEYRRVWEISGQILDILAVTLKTRSIPVKRYRELFTLVAANYDMGTIPQTLDSVTVGSAERIRTDAPKIVFVLGVNDRVFPYIPDTGGIYTDAERKKLISLGMELSSPVGDRIQEEKLIAYQTMTRASERLYLTARKADIRGNTMAVSYLFPQLKKMFGEAVIADTDDLDRLYFCKTPQTAFSVLAYQFRQDTSLTATLKEYFSTQPSYARRIAEIANQLYHRAHRLEDKEVIRKLFGEKVTMSPTRIEEFHKCKFRYFCEHGLQLRPRQKIRLNAVNKGTIVHDILYRVCTKIKDFSRYDEEQLKSLIQEAVDESVNQMGGYAHQTKRFLYLYHRIQKNVLFLLRRLFEELAQSGFHPVSFEYKIGQAGNVPPFIFRSADGIMIRIQGTVDRVDLYESPSGEKYLRIIDYKTGTKSFQLSDVANGINLQMFLYLMCLELGKHSSAEEISGAGALYMPAGDFNARLDRNSGNEQLKGELLKHYCMKGVLLDREEVIRAMEPDLEGKYIPVSVKKSTAYDKNNHLKEDVFVDRKANEEYFKAGSGEYLLSGEQISKIYSFLEDTVEKMVQELYRGNIEAKPLVGSRINGCDFCEFSQVCGYRETEPVNEYRDLNKKEMFEWIDSLTKEGRS